MTEESVQKLLEFSSDRKDLKSRIKELENFSFRVGDDVRGWPPVLAEAYRQNKLADIKTLLLIDLHKQLNAVNQAIADF